MLGYIHSYMSRLSTLRYGDADDALSSELSHHYHTLQRAPFHLALQSRLASFV